MAPLDTKAIIHQIDAVLEQTRRLLPQSRHSDFSDYPEEKITQAVTFMLAAIQRLAPPGSSYLKNAQAYEKHLTGDIGDAVSPLRGILAALRTDYDSGHLQSVVELVHADIFADFLDMADYLLQQGYKDPAAVITGSVLEEHLRKLCEKVKIPTSQPGGAPKKADALNSELAGASVYLKLDQKSVTAWLDLRNKAAHGRYAEYTKDQVTLMLQGVRDFLTRNPA